jgi:CheY-like chemotaxis protein
LKLALGKSLVELHGGTVTCTSAGPGKGSCFTLRLARTTAHQGSIAFLQHDEKLSDRAKKLRILVVDDNVDTALMLQMLREELGHNVLVAHTARHALEHARLNPIDVGILDLGFPDMDGTQLARKFRSVPSPANKTLIALTGYGQEQDREAAMHAGFDYHMVRPVDMQRLVTLLADLDTEYRWCLL